MRAKLRDRPPGFMLFAILCGLGSIALALFMGESDDGRDGLLGVGFFFSTLGAIELYRIARDALAALSEHED